MWGGELLDKAYSSVRMGIADVKADPRGCYLPSFFLQRAGDAWGSGLTRRDSYGSHPLVLAPLLSIFQCSLRLGPMVTAGNQGHFSKLRFAGGCSFSDPAGNSIPGLEGRN